MQIVTQIVTAARNHPALLGWYVNDEYKVYYLAMLEERARLLASLDPHHVLYSVEDTGNATRLREYRNTSTLFGVDPYPWIGLLKLRRLSLQLTACNLHCESTL